VTDVRFARPGLAVVKVGSSSLRGPDGRHKNPLFEESRAILAAFAGTEGGGE
jgi:hypothetical protein